MYSKFLSLEPEKQQRIVNAALKEFGQKGYEKASTNEIVKNAGISKGLLFHYFQNKKQLNIFLFEYSVEMMMDEFFGEMDLLEKDVLKRYVQITRLKLNLFKKYPSMFDFITNAIQDESVKEQTKLKETIESAYHKVFDGIDYSLFKEGVDIQKALQVIIWTFQGFGEQEQENMKELDITEYDIDKIVEDMNPYIELLRDAFYQ
ncbi:TetR family transcriptional regulator [Aquibacillus halophilus]|uniref:TetR family transcriptional regulator n=1 Tax=Aquibacillus halophilus TaxID=930132 RepID=A0A6A8DDA0_9BACI|nr:TetR/AcrR family transcriptional regulator [Aquibacillus halophilus]MRH43675.1 TetR family transcriptional regulator [Aquibacillus halophilus]